MPLEDDKTTVASSESAKAEPKKGGSKKIMLFGGVGLLCVIIGVGVAFMLSRGKSAEQTEAGTEGTKVEESTEHDSSDKDDAHAEKKASESTVYTIKDIVVNPAGTGGSRFLSVSFGFELETAELAATLEAREPIVRDALITILSSKTVAQLTDSREKEITRLQVKTRLMQLLKTEDLAGVYYTDFVLQ